MSVADKILGTVNAPYGVKVTACELAAAISDMTSVTAFHMQAFSFFSEVRPELQRAFVAEMKLSEDKVTSVARGFQELAGYPLRWAA
ncbi:hypothetical protein [Pannonibacter phragmitetus]|uniref:hypothetical protein n=1 Tax=Pannonibacter phragmitetus TaxID=121719 RepID=UPI000B979F4C|nr:hypothetical protein [Pannonibacter phragmitetus]